MKWLQDNGTWLGALGTLLVVLITILTLLIQKRRSKQAAKEKIKIKEKKYFTERIMEVSRNIDIALRKKIKAEDGTILGSDDANVERMTLFYKLLDSIELNLLSSDAIREAGWLKSGDISIKKIEIDGVDEVNSKKLAALISSLHKNTKYLATNYMKRRINLSTQVAVLNCFSRKASKYLRSEVKMKTT